MARVLWLSMLALAGCAKSDEDIANDLFEEVEGWEDWTQIAPWDGYQVSSDGTHGSHVLITFNDIAADAWGDDELPDGSISVKKGYDAANGEQPRNFITIMKKIDGYDPERNDWFWLRVDDDGGLGTAIGSDAFCYGCHTSGTDYLRTVTDVPGDAGE